MKLKRLLFLSFLLIVPGCGDDSENAEGTVFDPPPWVNNIDPESPSPFAGTGTDDTSPTSTTFRGARMTIADVAEPLVVPEGNVVDNSTAVQRSLVANGTADDGSTLLTVSWSVLSTISPPVTVTLRAPTDAQPGNDEGVLTYSETVTGAATITVTAVTAGEMVVERWSDTRVVAEFEAEILMADGTARSISNGIIDVRLQ